MICFLLQRGRPPRFLFFFFNDTATTEIYTLSLHDALPISNSACSASRSRRSGAAPAWAISPLASPLRRGRDAMGEIAHADRKSTRLNSSHQIISHSLFFFKKKKQNHNHTCPRTHTYILLN